METKVKEFSRANKIFSLQLNPRKHQTEKKAAQPILKFSYSMNFNPNMKTKHPVFAEIKQKFNKILELHRNPPQKLKQPKIANASIKKILSMYIPKENLENRTKFNSQKWMNNRPKLKISHKKTYSSGYQNKKQLNSVKGIQIR